VQKIDGIDRWERRDGGVAVDRRSDASRSRRGWRHPAARRVELADRCAAGADRQRRRHLVASDEPAEA
jgi:hypothetical protein